MDRPILCLVVDRATSVLPLEDAVREAVRGGVDWVQIRERELPDAELLEWSEALAAAAKGSEHPVAVVINPAGRPIGETGLEDGERGLRGHGTERQKHNERRATKMRPIRQIGCTLSHAHKKILLQDRTIDGHGITFQFQA